MNYPTVEHNKDDVPDYKETLRQAEEIFAAASKVKVETSWLNYFILISNIGKRSKPDWLSII